MTFLDVVLSMPTVVFTVPLAFVLLYWAMVGVGMMDLDMFDLDLDLDVDADVEVEVDLDVDVDADVGGLGGAAAALGFLGFGRVPTMISVSLLVVAGWVTTSMLGFYALPALEGVAPAWLLATGSGLAGAAAAIGTSRAGSALLGPHLEVDRAPMNASFVGSEVVVSTGRVDAGFGQAKLDDGGAGLLVQVRHDTGHPALVRGARALLIDYDAERGVYLAEPMEALLDPSVDPAPGSQVVEPDTAQSEARVEVSEPAGA